MITCAVSELGSTEVQIGSAPIAPVPLVPPLREAPRAVILPPNQPRYTNNDVITTNQVPQPRVRETNVMTPEQLARQQYLQEQLARQAALRDHTIPQTTPAAKPIPVERAVTRPVQTDAAPGQPIPSADMPPLPPKAVQRPAAPPASGR